MAEGRAKKRRAEDELTPENWQGATDKIQPDGGFEKASEEELSSRSFRKAKRRLAGGESNSSSGNDSDKAAPSAFAGFKGFSSVPSSSAAVGQSKTFASYGGVGQALGAVKPTPTVASAAVSSKAMSTENTLTQEEYEARLSSLNTSFVKWITKHHEQDPLADFTPTFDDYKKHLAKLDAQLQSSSDAKSVASSAPTTASGLGTSTSLPRSNGAASGISLGGSLSSTASSKASTASSVSVLESKSVAFAPISTGAPTSSSSTSTSLFSFGGSGSGSTALSAPAEGALGSGLKVASSGITFPASCLKPTSTAVTSGVLGLAPATNVSSGFFSGLAAGGSGCSSTLGGGGIPSFLLGGAKKDEGKGDAEGGADADDEDDADAEKDDMAPQEFDQDADIVHSVRSKLFYQKDSAWTELGIGTFKVINTDGKTQLLMRNATRLGTILLNVLLNKTTPCTRSGKNNVMLMTVPNPPLHRTKDGKATEESLKPVSYLIRVKTKEEADELHEKIAARKDL